MVYKVGLCREKDVNCFRTLSLCSPGENVTKSSNTAGGKPAEIRTEHIGNKFKSAIMHGPNGFSSGIASES